MVRFTSLYVSNFKCLNFEKEVPLPEGITLINGPNESGKSTILDAIMYALFGQVIRPSMRARKEDIISYGSNRSIVRLDFLLGGKKYRVERTIYKNRPTEAILWQVLPEGEDIKATGQRNVTDSIRRLMGGISFQELIASTVVAQKDLERLVRQPLEDRKRVINAFLNLESFNKALKDMEEERKSITGTPSRPGRLEFERQKLDELRRQLKEYWEKREKFESLRASIKRLDREIAELEKSLGEVQKTFSILESYRNILNERHKINGEILSLNRYLESLRKDISELDKRSGELEKVEESLKGYEDLDEAGKVLADVKETLRSLEKVEADIVGIRGRCKEIEGEISKLREKLKSIDLERLSKIEAGSSRYSLKFIILAVTFGLAILMLFLDMNLPAILFIALSFLTLVITLRDFIAESKLRSYLVEGKTLKRLEEELYKLMHRLEPLENEAKSKEETALKEMRSIPRYLTVLEANLQKGIKEAFDSVVKSYEKDTFEREKLRNKAQLLREELMKKTEKEQEATHIMEKLSKLNESLSRLILPELPSGIQYSEEVFEDYRGKLDSLKRNYYGLLQRREDEAKTLEELKNYLEKNKNLPEKVSEQEAVVEKLEHRLRVLTIAIEAAEKTSEALRNRVRPNVERNMSRLLPIITAGRYKAVRLEEDYTLKVWDPEAGEFKVKEVFSGGTEDQILLAMRLAFALALLPEAKGAYPEFLFLDEPLASSDEDRRFGIIRLLETYLSSKFKQIFLISHIRDLEDYVQNVIRLDSGRVVELRLRRREAINFKTGESWTN